MWHLLGKQALWGGGGWGISCIERASRHYGEGVGGASPGQASIMGRGWVWHLLGKQALCRAADKNSIMA